MFKISQAGTYTWPVTVKVPANNGTYATHKFTAEFKRLKQSELEDMEKRGITDRQYAAEVMAGWGDDVLDVENNPVPFNSETLAQFLDEPVIAGAIVLAHRASITGALLKN